MTLIPIANLGDPGIDRALALRQAAGTAPNPALIDASADTAVHRRRPLPFAELDAAGRALLERHGVLKATRDALEVLDAAEVLDLAALIDALDVDGVTLRLRNIAGGSLRAGRCEKAQAAKCLELAGALAIASALRNAPVAA